MSNPKRGETLADLYGEFSERLQGDRWQPSADVVETGADVIVRIEIPGVRSEDLRVTVDGDVLRVRGVRNALLADDLRRLHQVEIATGPFERRVRIPVPFDRERVNAHLEEGMLTVTLPRRLPRKVSVEGT